LMRTMGFLAACVMAWALSLGAMASAHAADGTPAAGEISQCLIPMRDAVPPLTPCGDRPPSWSGPEQPDPQREARRVR
jgi:hypothetical protein